jgi:uncharacterized membrane protein
MGWSIRRQLGGTPAGTFSPSEGTGTQDRLLPTGRLEAFSDGVFAIAITLLVLELHVPGEHQVLAAALEHEWPRYLGYFVSFTFIGGVWIAHSNLTRFIKAADPTLMRLNLMLLLFVSFLTFDQVGTSSPGERVAVVVFGLNLTLAALMLYLLLRHAGSSPGIPADDIAEEELQAFAKERRTAMLLQGSATVVGGFLPLTAVLFYLAVSVFFIIDPLRHIRLRRARPPRADGPA